MNHTEQFEKFRQDLFAFRETNLQVFIMALLSLETDVTDQQVLAQAYEAWMEADGETTFLSDFLMSAVDTN